MFAPDPVFGGPYPPPPRPAPPPPRPRPQPAPVAVRPRPQPEPASPPGFVVPSADALGIRLDPAAADPVPPVRVPDPAAIGIGTLD